MKSIDQPVTASFRFLSLDMMQAYTLKKEVSGAWFYKDEAKEVFVGVVPLIEAHFDELNDYFIRQQLAYDECDIYVEATAQGSEKTAQVNVPREVNRVLKYLDCPLTYAVKHALAAR